jgi:hypothetical protein
MTSYRLITDSSGSPIAFLKLSSWLLIGSGLLGSGCSCLPREGCSIFGLCMMLLSFFALFCECLEPLEWTECVSSSRGSCSLGLPRVVSLARLSLFLEPLEALECTEWPSLSCEWFSRGYAGTPMRRVVSFLAWDGLGRLDRTV